MVLRFKRCRYANNKVHGIIHYMFDKQLTLYPSYFFLLPPPFDELTLSSTGAGSGAGAGSSPS